MTLNSNSQGFHWNMASNSKCQICQATNCVTLYESNFIAEEHSGKEVNPYDYNYNIKQCCTCSLIFADPIFTKDGIDRLYTSGISTGVGESNGTNISLGEENNVLRTMQKYFNYISPHLNKKNAYLDVGCDSGTLLKIADKNGFKEIYGVEPNLKQAEKVGRDYPHFNVKGGYHEEISHNPASFDLITLIHVLDHIKEPGDAIKKIHDELTPGGMAFAVVHNVKSIPALLLGRRFPPFNLYHFYYFSKKTLRELFTNQGFEIIGIYSTPNVYSIAFVLEKIELIFFKKTKLSRLIAKTLIGKIPICIRLGNIGVLVRKPL
jgi:SAM-dependent methyltransferase